MLSNMIAANHILNKLNFQFLRHIGHTSVALAIHAWPVATGHDIEQDLHFPQKVLLDGS